MSSDGPWGDLRENSVRGEKEVKGLLEKAVATKSALTRGLSSQMECGRGKMGRERQNDTARTTATMMGLVRIVVGK